MRRYEPAYTSELRFEDYITLTPSMLKQGVLTGGRKAYWSLFFEALREYPHAFGTAITLAMMGHHFHTLTKRVCGNA